MHKLDDMMVEIPMYSKKDQLNTLRNKCEHPIWRILVYLASLRSKQGGTEQGTVCHIEAWCQRKILNLNSNLSMWGRNKS